MQAGVLGAFDDLGFPGDSVGAPFLNQRTDKSRSNDRKDRYRRRLDDTLSSDQIRIQDRDRKPDLTEADNTPVLYNPFDGSEFNASTFIDTDFSQRMFRHLSNSMDKRKRDADFPPVEKDRDDSKKDRSVDRLKKEMDEKRDRDWRQFLRPSPELPALDWVPDKLDPVSNGGFEVSPDNGSPVPYRLNGHVDLQPKLPWRNGSD